MKSAAAFGGPAGSSTATAVSAARGERQKPGALRRELDCLLAEASVQHRGPDLEHTVRASRRPAICLRLFMRAFTRWLTVPSACEVEIGLPAR